MRTILDTLPLADRMVGAVLRDVEDARKDDRILLLEVWDRQGLHLNKDQKAMFMRVMSAETIRRSRQLIQEKGFYRDIATYRQRQLAGDFVKSNI